MQAEHAARQSVMNKSVPRSEFRRVVTSAALGQFVEWYDFVVYAYSAGVIARLFFPNSDPVAALLAAFAVYAVGFLMRPVGGLVFGVLGDRLGRRGILALIILLMGGSTVAIGLLPTYQQIGIYAPILLVLCRLVQGLSAAGEATGSNSFVAEHAPTGQRGRWVALTYSFANIAPVVAALVVLLISNMMSGAEYDSWGWRIPFIIGGPLALVGLYIRSKVDETPAFKATIAARRTAATPLRDAFQYNRKAMGFTFALAALSSLGFYTLAGYFVSYLTGPVGLSKNDALISNSIALFIAFLSMNIGGYLSDILGRRFLIIGDVFLSAIACVPGYLLASHGTLWSAILGQGLIALCTGPFWGAMPIVLLELFPTRTRFTGSAISLNLAYAMFGGTAPYIGTWLVAATGSKLAPAYYGTAIALLVLFVAFALPETFKSSLVHAEDEKN